MDRSVRCSTLIAAWLVVWGAIAAPVAAQPVFFDDFNGDSLLPHWVQPPPTDWEYNVGDGMLNVTRGIYPSSPQTPKNVTLMAASIPTLSDFRVDVRMGWDEGRGPRRLGIGIAGGAYIASMTYALGGDPESVPIIFVGNGLDGFPLPAPTFGLHDFVMTRAGSRLEFYLDGSFFGSLTDDFNLDASVILFDFAGPYPGEQGSFHIDQIRIIPVPASGMIWLSLVLTTLGYRRRSVE